jgi:hypothetical protein
MRAILIALSSAMLLPGGVPPEAVAWSRTPDHFAGKSVVVRLRDGTKIEGVWASVSPGSFTMKVEGTSNRRIWAKGLRTIPRSSIVKVEVSRRRIRWRIVGMVSGLYAVAGLVAAFGGGEALEAPALLLAGYGAAAAGFLGGRSLDRATHEVILIPD